MTARRNFLLGIFGLLFSTRASKASAPGNGFSGRWFAQGGEVTISVQGSTTRADVTSPNVSGSYFGQLQSETLASFDTPEGVMNLHLSGDTIFYTDASGNQVTLRRA